MFSDNKLYASISHYGVGTFANSNLKPNEEVMEIPANYTISCFDRTFPYMDLADKVVEQYKHETGPDNLNFFRLILNFNYMRYIGKNDRFFKIYFDNLPEYMEYFPFWPEEEKHIVKKLLHDPLMATDLLLHNETVIDYMLEDLKRLVRRKDSNIASYMLSDVKVQEAINIINSRGYIFTLKGWKVIHNKLNEIEPNDIYNFGYIIIPGADAINHESVPTEHPDVAKSNFAYETGKVVVKAGRKFKMGEEFFINYDKYSGVFEIFKRYGFLPIDSIIYNQMYRNEMVNMTDATLERKQLCMALKACVGNSPNENFFYVPKWTNSLNMAHLNIERMNYWIGPPINEYKVIDVYNQIRNNKHSNMTEGIALSKFTYSFYGLLLYSSNFRTGIDSLLAMYNMNEKHVDLREIFKITNIKIHLKEHPPTIHQRFRELLKFALLNQHMVAVNVKKTAEMLDRNLDNLWIEARKEIIENI